MNEEIKVSIIICTYNRDKYLPEVLKSVTSQTSSKELFECIIVDNNSADTTATISKTFVEENKNLNTKYVFEENKGLSFARNKGIKEAAGLVIAYVDDDAILAPDYVKEIDRFFEENSDAVGIGGKVIPKYESGQEPIWMNKYLNGFIGKVDYGNNVLLFNNKMKYPAGCNMIYKKEILLKAGGFNNDLKFRSDDKYIFYKVKTISNQIFYVPDVWLYHYIDSYRLTFDNFKNLFLKTGNEEKLRIKKENGWKGILKKFAEYVFKLCASVIIYLIFFLKNKEVKGRYVIASQWFTLKGFLKQDIFVR